MSTLKLRARIGAWRPSKARRLAAERALDENFTGLPAELGPDAPAGLEAELSSMRSLVQTLEQLPGQAWSPKLTTVNAPDRAPAASRQPRRAARKRMLRGLSGALATAALAFVIGALIHPFSGGGRPQPSLPGAAARVVLRPLPGSSVTGEAVAYMPGGGQMLLHVRNLAPSAPGTYYELWLMTSNTDLVSVTSFRTDAAGAASLRLALPDDPSHYRYLDISLQRVGDSDTISQDNVLRALIPA